MAQIVKVRGLEELKANFARIGAEIGPAVLKPTSAAGASVIRAGARSSSAFYDHTGILRRSIIMKFIREESNATQAVFYVTARKGKSARSKLKASSHGATYATLSSDAFYAGWVERGHKVVHRFKGKYEDFPLFGRKRRTGLTDRRRQQEYARTLGEKSGVRTWVDGRFFLRGAFNTRKDAALTAMMNKMTQQFRSVLRTKLNAWAKT